MSQDYGIDNEGTGFDFDDDEEDIEKVFNRVSQAADPGEDNDDSHLAYVYDDQNTDQYVENHVIEEQQTPAPGTQEQENIANETEDIQTGSAWEVIEENSNDSQIVHEVPTYDDTIENVSDDNYENHEEFVVESSPAPEVDESPQSYSSASEQKIYNTEKTPIVNRVEESSYDQPRRYGTHSATSPAPSYNEPVPEPVANNAPASSNRRFNIPTEKEDIAHAAKVIQIIDVYRNLSNQNVVAQLIYNENEVDHKDEAALVVKALRADPILSEMMTALREAALEKDRVERVFYVLRLERHLLNYLGDFLTTIVGAEFTDKSDQIGFSKEIETVINGLDSKIVQIVADAQSVLAAAHE